MVGPMCISQALAAVLAFQVLRAASAEGLEEECTPASVAGAGGDEECTPSSRRGAGLLQTAKRASLAGQGQSEAEQNKSGPLPLYPVLDGSVSYCYEKDIVNGCWARKPPSHTPECTPDSSGTCRCSTAECRFSMLTSDPPTTARCADKVLYVKGGHIEYVYRGSGLQRVSGDGLEMYCTRMVKSAAWKAKHLVRLPGDHRFGVEVGVGLMGRLRCWGSGHKWEHGKCYKKVRFLGEACGRRSDCALGGGKHQTWCVEGKCVPAGFFPREECDCIGHPSPLVCSAPSSCGDYHPCSKSLDSDKRYCDFGYFPWSHHRQR
mmetsp:Transcript_38590/g.104513  ORF Transcript_38590/g.104513 Transcript_38590/m.104513 type:complete len:319 (-) Transcript_38590:66-1022(-)